jgi:hypothetical protein
VQSSAPITTEDALLASCPFCQGEVEEEKVLYGGPCPHCFGEIPGEETPTDPGEDEKERIRQQDIKRASNRALLPVFVLAPVVTMAVIGVAFMLQPNEAVTELDFDDSFEALLEFEPLAYDASMDEPGQDAGKALEGSVVPSRAVAKSRTAPVTRNAGSGAKTAGVQAGEYRPTGRTGSRSATTRAGGTLPGDLADGLKTGSSSSTGGLDLAIQVQRGGSRLLVEESDIVYAVKEMFAQRKPQIRQCYERALKANPSFAGTWKLSLVLNEAGKVGEYNAKPTGASDVEFESCIEEKAATWSVLGRLEKPRSFSLPLTFQSRG